MSEPAKARQKVRFGDFEVDLLTAELRTNGHELSLQGQPFQILIVLLERPGELVTRGELKKILWPSDTFVDFEHSLNKAVNRLREALGDSAEAPKFVETLPRKGYRWIGPALQSGHDNATSENLLVVPAPEEIGTGPHIVNRQNAPHPSASVPDEKIPESHRWQRVIWLALLGLVAIGTVARVYWFLTPLPAPKVLAYTPLTHDRERKFPPLVTDGPRLYFMLPKATGWTIAETSASGGETVAVSSHFDDIQLSDISASGSEVLIGLFNDSTDVPIYSLPLPAGLPRRVGNILAHAATWSPNGELIAYASGNELFLAKPDGSESRRLVSLTGPASWLRWSPDGKVLRFTVDNNSVALATSLWEVASDGTGLRPLLPGWNSSTVQCCGNWTPDGNYFVFQSDLGINESTLWAIREKSGLLHRRDPAPAPLTTGQSMMISPAPSRDGRKLFAIQAATQGQLVRYDPQSQQFAPYLSGISAIGLGFSKDGQWVAYISFPDGTLWRSKVDGTERLRLTSSPMVAGSPQWSPDGKQIAFAAFMPGKTMMHIHIVSAEGGVPKEVTRGELVDFFPNWSRDGDSLFFGNLPFDVAGAPSIGIYKLDLKTSKLTTLIGSEDKWYPSLSPDNNYIVALSRTNHLMLFALKAQKWQELTKTTADHPAWSHDGRYVYFDSTAGGEPAFYRVRITDHRVERVARLKDVKRPTSGTSASWTGLAPDDSPLALRDISTFEIYALDWQLP